MVRLRPKATLTVTIGLFAIALPVPSAAAASGDLDLSFGTAGKVTTDFNATADFAEALAVQPADGKIVAAGCDTSVGCIPSRSGDGNNFEIARYHLNGALDTTFGGGDGKVATDFEGRGAGAADVAVRQDGRIVAAGSAGTCIVACGRGLAVARYETSGAPDLTFGTGGEIITSPVTADLSYLEGHAVTLHEGKTIVAGAACNNRPFTGGCDYDFVLARYLDNGLLDTSFGGDGLITLAFGSEHDQANAVHAYPDGKILVGGYSSAGTTCTDVCLSDWDFALARLNPDGSLDTTFGGGDGKVTTNLGGADELKDFAFQEGKIVAAGSKRVWQCFSTGCSSVGDAALARYNADGVLDTSFGAGKGTVTMDLGGDDSASGVAIDTLHRIVVAGWACSTSTTGCGNDFVTVRYHSDGALDTAFGSSGKATTDFGGSDRASDVVIQGDGKIVAAGTDSFLGGDADFALARYQAGSTSTDDTTSPEAPNLLSPSNTATINDSTPTFDWSDVSDPSGVSYQLQADDSDATFGSPELDLQRLSSSSVTPSAALGDGRYHWRVRATDGAGNAGSWSTTFSLTVDSTAPTAPSDLRATAGKRKIALNWSSSTDGGATVSYDIYRSTSSSGPYAAIASTTNLDYTDTGLKAGRTYWYYVTAVDRAGNASAPSGTASATVR